ncbi:hypothetical protein NQ176_g253 [Zarea fungicola]|uniref:Uncharacterized protein n=1 Tax=Zarea fungicola TaxID=93591 RepID=A0ACC1NY81_9HYPO|nr:hypothetical protein NQ176_g253 [Lecanicillium fungicola]
MPSMATIEDIEDAITQLKETGIYHVKNGDIGTAILGMEETGSQFSISEGGLTFYKRNVFANDIIRAILAKTLKQSYLGFYTKLKEDPGHIILLRKGGQSPDILCVLLWNKGSRVTYYPGSHLKPLDSYRGANRIWEVTSASLDNAGCQPQYIDFDDGGW